MELSNLTRLLNPAKNRRSLESAGGSQKKEDQLVGPFERLPAWTADRLTRLRVQNQAARMITVTVVEIKHVEQSP